MLLKLEIKRQDGSDYWSEHFMDYDSANEWIAEEQTRPYWDSSFTYTITDVTPVVETISPEQAELEAKMAKGKAAREACLSVLDYIAGCNLDKELSIEQITTMQQTFASAEAALKAGRPTFARNFIEAIQPDGYILTEEEKGQCLLLLTGY